MCECVCVCAYECYVCICMGELAAVGSSLVVNEFAL